MNTAMTRRGSASQYKPEINRFGTIESTNQINIQSIYQILNRQADDIYRLQQFVKHLLNIVNSPISPTVVQIDNTFSPYSAPDGVYAIFVDTDTADVTINLPIGKIKNYYRIINCGSSGNEVTLVPSGTELLTGVNASRTMSDGTVIDLAYQTIEGWW